MLESPSVGMKQSVCASNMQTKIAPESGVANCGARQMKMPLRNKSAAWSFSALMKRSAKTPIKNGVTMAAIGATEYAQAIT